MAQFSLGGNTRKGGECFFFFLIRLSRLRNWLRVCSASKPVGLLRIIWCVCVYIECFL